MTWEHADQNRSRSDEKSNSVRPDAGLQFGLMDLFFVMAFGAAIALAFSSRWATATAFAGAFVFASIVGLLFVVAGERKRFVIGSVFLTLICLGLLLPAAAAVVFVHGLASLFLCCLPAMNPKIKTRIRISMVCIAIAMIAANFEKPRQLSLLLEARAEFPIEDLSPRLRYELERRHNKIDSSAEIELAMPVSTRLVSMESQLNEVSFGRVWALERLHDKNYEKFVRSNGFGFARMIPVSPYRARAPRIPTIGFAGLEFSEADRERVREMKWQSLVPDGFTWDTEESFLATPSEFHDRSELDFLLPESLGFVQSTTNVVGFSSHAFHFPPMPLHREQDGAWRLSNLQLVSLLKFDQPRVYELDHLPRMDHLASGDIPTRSLDGFEENALPCLMRDEDYVIQESATTIRMLGSLRAGKNCLPCHSVRRGELLGAFTYEFERN